MNATKGFKFIKLPKILTFQVGRFTLDFTTFTRQKLNDKVSFPLYLNMNHFLKDELVEDSFKKFVEKNPLTKVVTSDLKVNVHEEHKKAMDEVKVGGNETSQAFKDHLEQEIGVGEDMDEKRQGILENKRKNETKKAVSLHSSNLKSMKGKMKSVKSSFNRKNLNPNFAVNAK